LANAFGVGKQLRFKSPEDKYSPAEIAPCPYSPLFFALKVM
jgi:hypothetical protein